MNILKKIFLLALVLFSLILLSSCTGKETYEPAEELSVSEEYSEMAEITELTETTAITEITAAEKETEEAKEAETFAAANVTVSAAKYSTIYEEYFRLIKENVYPATEYITYERVPDHALFDFNKDGIPELLVWEERVASAVSREIRVYTYNEEKHHAEKIGVIMIFEGHTNKDITPDGMGIIVSIRDSSADTVTEYRMENGRIVSETLRTRTAESTEEWNTIMDYYENPNDEKLQVYDTYEDIETLD